MTLGPVQVLIVEVDGPETAATVLASVAALPADAPVRCLDSFAVAVQDDGDIVADTAGSPSLALFAREAGGDGDDDEEARASAGAGTWSLADVVPPGGRAVVVLLEHRWAVGLRASMLAAGAALVHESWLDEQDRLDLEGLLPDLS